MGAIAEGLQGTRQRIREACQAAGRGAECARLLAVSKTFPASAVRAARAAGQTCFGESYVQEAVTKIAELADLDLEWHFIGPLQSNKTRPVAEHFAWVHSVDRERIAERLSEQRPPHLPPLNICIQVNVSGESSKSGCAPADALPLARFAAHQPRLRLRGFMTIPEPSSDTELQRARFRQLADLLAAARAEGLTVDTLSMGMSGDLDNAILEGATLVRVGTAIFGARHFS